MTSPRLLALTAAALALALAGCGSTPAAATDPPVRPASLNGTIRSGPVALPDGREVLCVTWKSGYGGGISCDFRYDVSEPNP